MKLDDVLPASYRECFGCGADNPFGINLHDLRLGDDGVTRATLRPSPHHVGFPGVLHGGIAMAALDEVMAYACTFTSGSWVATAKTEVKFRRPVPADGELLLEAGVTSGDDSRRFRTWAKLLLDNDDRTVGVEATGLFLPAPEAMTALLD
jgi:acyl-coenzyme A thioesterase PaaI-like protein